MKTTRVQIELPEQAMARLKSLKELTEAFSYSEVIKNALKVYEKSILEEITFFTVKPHIKEEE